MLLTKQHLVNTVDDRWKKQYYLNSSWDYYGDDKVEKYEELASLGKNKNPEDVDKIIGNSSWTRIICIIVIKMSMLYLYLVQMKNPCMFVRIVLILLLNSLIN